MHTKRNIELSVTPLRSHALAPMHTMFKYVVLWYAEEISLSLFEGPFYLKNVLYVPFSVCFNL